MPMRQDLADASRIPAPLLDTLADLRAGRAAAQAEADEVTAERQALAAAGRRREAAALHRIAELNARSMELAVGIDRLAANEGALTERFAEALELQQKPAPGRPCPISIGRAIAGQDAQADAVMAKLSAVLFARAALIQRLAGTGKATRGLASPGRLQAAAACHGLPRYFAMQPIADHLQAPLAALTAPLLHNLTHPQPRRLVPEPGLEPVKIIEEVTA